METDLREFRGPGARSTAATDLAVSCNEPADQRITSVLAVLGGVSAASVARRSGVAEAVVDGWVAAFVAAGSAALTDTEAEPDPRPTETIEHLGLVAHELRSPLAMIRGWAELVLDDPCSEVVAARAGAGILTQADRLARLAEDILDASSVALGRRDLDLHATDVGELVRGVLAARPEDRTVVEVGGRPWVVADRDRIGQVLDNLLENVRRHVGAPARISVRARAGGVEVVVASDGPAIPAHLAEQLFQPFERGEAAGPGAGLGLYVCSVLVGAHGGEMGVRADEEGNCFWLWLPAQPPESGRRSGPSGPMTRSPVTT